MPTISQVHGFAVAGGSDIATSCEIIVMPRMRKSVSGNRVNIGTGSYAENDSLPTTGHFQASSEQIVFDDAVERADAIFPTDLLALFVSSSVIRNADLIDSTFGFRQLGGNFGLESESILL